MMHFFKLQGAGNDFVVFDCRNGELSLEALIESTPRICDRRFGIGCDGVMALFPPELPDTSYTMIYRNADGSDAGMCGNGGRCIAKLATHLGVESTHAFSVHHHVYTATVRENSVQLTFPSKPAIQTIADEKYGSIFRTHTGTEHIVVYIEPDLFQNDDYLRSEGKRLRFDPRFGNNGTNVNFLLSHDEALLQVKTYERGVEDLTLACGTGTIAAAIVHQHISQVNNGRYVVDVNNTGGVLRVHFDVHGNQYSNLMLEGPAILVFEGDFRV